MVGTRPRIVAVKYIQAEHEFSERGSCKAVNISRSTVRYKSKPKAGEIELRERIRALAHENRRYGC